MVASIAPHTICLILGRDYTQHIKEQNQANNVFHRTALQLEILLAIRRAGAAHSLKTALHNTMQQLTI